jgi:tetratricopeptide (TPR) repeat protein
MDRTSENTSKRIKEAFQFFKNGELLGAKKILDQVLELSPENFDSLYLYAAVSIQEENFPLAKKLLGEAVRIRPNSVEALFNLAVVFEKIDEAEQSLFTYDALLTIQPNHLKALYNKASILAKQGFLEIALKNLEQVLEIDPNLALAAKNYAEIKMQLQMQSSIFEQNNNAVSQFESQNFENLHNTGLAHFNKKDINNAIDFFKQALQLKPNSLEANHNLAMALEKTGRLNDALTYYKDALQINGESSPTLNNIGNVYRELGLLEKSRDSLLAAIKINPVYAEAFNNLGWTYYCLRQFQEANDCFEEALEINPNLIETKYNLGLSQLMQGDFENGWLNYEYRTQQPNYKKRELPLDRPQWYGNESIDKKIIYIHSEQGLGDTFQFSRYLKPLADRGAKILFEPGITLLPLFQDQDYPVQLIKPGDVIPKYDFHCPLMSLPLAFKTTLMTIPNLTPYIQANKEKEKKWGERVSKISGPKVGLVWNGGFRANQPELWEVNNRRNIAFELISQINIPHIQFFSLQKGVEAEKILHDTKEQHWPEHTQNFHNFIRELHDFSDTAALIANLDLVISVDTSTAHLAGAMNKPVWILNRHDNCWRWLESGEQSPWYPSVKLYRKKYAEGWENIVQKVRQDLLEYFLPEKN